MTSFFSLFKILYLFEYFISSSLKVSLINPVLTILSTSVSSLKLGAWLTSKSQGLSFLSIKTSNLNKWFSCHLPHELKAGPEFAMVGSTSFVHVRKLWLNGYQGLYDHVFDLWDEWINITSLLSRYLQYLMFRLIPPTHLRASFCSLLHYLQQTFHCSCW